MNVLHISSDYPYTPIYRQLLTELELAAEFEQTMYVPLPTTAQEYEKYDLSTASTRVVYSKDFRRAERILFHRKRLKVAAAITTQLSLSRFDVVHAHYLFSAGGPALQLLDRNAIPYVVAVRNTDVNLFNRMRHLRAFGLEVLRRAGRVVFISPAHQASVIKQFIPLGLESEIIEKSDVIPNGVDSFWLDNQPGSPRVLNHNRPRLLFVGEFTRNKNIDTTVAVVDELRRRGSQASLVLVGDGDRSSHITKLIQSRTAFVKRFGWTGSKRELLHHYRSTDFFIMPSLRETFGLVYIEALSQGIPILYTRGQGVDGYFEEGEVGYAVDPMDPLKICDRIELIMGDYGATSQRAIHRSTDFNWARIARRYADVYDSIAAR